MSALIDTIVKWWTTWFCALIAGGLIMLWKRVGKNYSTHEAENSAMKEAVRSLIRKDLLDICYEVKSKGSITITERETMDDLFHQYFTLGGDGALHQLYDKIKQIQTAIENV